MSRQAWMSFIGMMNWDNNLFEQLVLPEEFTNDDKNTLIANLLMETGELELIYTDVDFMKDAIGAWSSKEVITWQRLYNAMVAEYNPIENYNRNEKITTQNRGALTHSGTDSVQGSGNDSDVGSGTDTTVNSITSFDSNGYQIHDKTELTKGSTITHNHGIKDTTTYGHVITDTTGSQVINETHGNIGVMSNQDMLLQEINIAPKLNIFDIIIKSFINRFCLLVY